MPTRQMIRYLATVLVMCWSFCVTIKAADSSSDSGAKHLVEVDKDPLGMYADQSDYFRRVVDMGARTVSVPDAGTFFVYWLPKERKEGGPLRVLVALHGTNGNAYRHLANFTDTAGNFGVGVVSVQWGWERKRGGGYEYLDTGTTYSLMARAVDYLAKKHDVSRTENAWLGFSRSATHCAIYAFLDKQADDHFAYFLGTSGACNANQPGMKKMLSGKVGDRPIAGARFYLWAGKSDRSPTTLSGSRVEDMQASQPLIERLGGVVDSLRIGPEGHGGFNHNKTYQEEAFALWMKQVEKKPNDENEAPMGEESNAEKREGEGLVALVKVEDGDTAVLLVEGGEEKVRLLGINAPGHGKVGAKEAAEGLRALLSGKKLALDFSNVTTKRDRYGRLVAVILANDENTSVAMVRAGHARADRTHWRLYGKGDLWQVLEAAERLPKAK